MLPGAMRLCCAVVLLSALATAQAVSQPAAPAAGQKTSKFTSSTELVLIPAIVTAKGKHVTGLHKEDFEVSEDGARKKLTVFEEVNASLKPLQRSGTPEKQVFSNIEPADTAPRRLKIIVIDEINTPFLDQTRARKALVKFLANTITANELTQLLLFKPGGIEVIHDFTSDPAVLVEALKRVRGRIAVTEGDTMLPSARTVDAIAQQSANPGEIARRAVETSIDDFLSRAEVSSDSIRTVAVENTLNAFEVIARSCVGLPGRKSLIWVSSGFPFMFSDRSAVLGPRAVQSRHVNMRLLSLFDALNTANVAVYPVDPTGLPSFVSPGVSPFGGGYAAIYWDLAQRLGMQAAHQEVVETMEEIAHMTGGVAYHDQNDIAAGLAQAGADSDAYYMVGYYVSRATTKPGWHKLKVHVRQPHLSVRARSGYFLMQIKDFTPDEVRIRDIANAVGSPLELTAISITGHWMKGTPVDGGKKRVDYLLDLNGVSVDGEDRNHINLQIVGFVSDGKLNEVTRTDQTIDAHPTDADMPRVRHGMTYANHFDLSPGNYSVKFVVRDNLGGRVGSLSAPLTVQ